MLDYVLLTASVDINDSTLVKTAETKLVKRVRYLGICINPPEPSETATDSMCKTMFGGSGTEASSDINNVLDKEDDVILLHRELDETLTIIEETVSELTRLDNSIKRRPDQQKLSKSNRLTDRQLYPTTDARIENSGIGDKVRQEGLSTNSKLECLLDSSFQITDRIMKKAQTISCLTQGESRQNTRCSDRRDQSLRKSRSAGTATTYSRLKKRHHRGSNHLDTLDDDEQIGMCCRDKDKPNGKYSKIKKRTIVNMKRTAVDVSGDSTLQMPDNLNEEEDVQTYKTSRVESPISCCFKESEDTCIPSSQAHPLEHLIKDRLETSKKKSKRRTNVWSLFDCKKTLTSDENDKKCVESDQKSKAAALEDFINRRRSTQTREETHRQTPSETMKVSSYRDRRNSINSTRLSELSYSYSSKHRLLQNLRFKKGLISVATLQKSLAPR